MQTQVADQAAIARLINTWLKRSGLKQHTVAQKAGLSENQFYHSYKNPDPKRRINTDPARALAVLQVFAECANPRSRATALEAIDFLRLTRFPIERYGEVAAWFGDGDWRQALAEVPYITPQPAAVAQPAAIPAEQPEPERVPGYALPRRHNLPQPLTRFIGRDAMIETIIGMLAADGSQGEQSGTRLLTLLGVGGVGKTRLALHAGRALIDAFADGVWFIDLAALTDAALVPRAIAKALNIPETGELSPLEQIENVIAARQMLLILDNCEHLIDACAAIVETLLGRCAELAILTTSREALRIGGETCLPVLPLSLPEPRRHAADAIPAQVAQHDLMQSEAAQMFSECARRSDPSFAVSEQNAPAIAHICRLVDGLPLAIELAAARLNLFSVEQLAVRLADRLGLLTGGSRTSASRQQTLRASIDWSYRLLSESERAALRRLAVFAGGWTLEAGEAIAACSVDLLGQLVQKSLVAVSDHTGGRRYHLLATIQQYALEKLAAANEAAAARDQHLRYFLELAEAEERHLAQAEHERSLKLLELEHDNFRAALDWAAQADTTAQLRLVAALYPFWKIRGYWSEGRERLMQALAHVPEASIPVLQARVTYGAALFAYHQGDTEIAAQLYAESLTRYEQTGDRLGIADALIGLGHIAWRRGHYEQAIERYSLSLEHYQVLDHQPGIALATQYLGTMYRDLNRYDQARPLLEHSLAMFRAQGNYGECATTLIRLGSILYQLGDYPLTQRYLAESLALQYRLGDPCGIAFSLMAIGGAAFGKQEYLQARQAYLEALELYREIGDKNGLGMMLNNLGEIDYTQGNYAGAREHYTAGLTFHRQSGHTIHIVNTLSNLGFNFLGMGDDQQAARHFGESFILAQELEPHNATIRSAANLIGIASICAEQDALQPACYLLGALESWLHERRHTLYTSEIREYDRRVAAIRPQLSDETLAAAWSAGQHTPLSEVLALVKALPAGSSANGLLPALTTIAGDAIHADLAEVAGAVG